MQTWTWAIPAAVALVVSTPAMAQDCGTADGICTVPEGEYRLVMPEGADGPVAAILHLHGWGASAAGALRDRDRRAAIAARGMAFIVAQGIPRAGRTQRDWAVRDGRPHPRDDIAFLSAVLDDAAARGVDRDRVLLTGFSRGGSFVWDVACEAPGFARAYAAVSGAFWNPLPEGCAGPVDLLHVHGWADGVVPLEGRAFTSATQGDVFAALFLLRASNGCDARHPDVTAAEAEPALWWRRWTGCEGGRIDLALHTGGHAPPRGWTALMLDWFGERLAA